MPETLKPDELVERLPAGSFEWKGKTYYRGPLVEGPFGSSRRISREPFPSICGHCNHDAVHTEAVISALRLRATTAEAALVKARTALEPWDELARDQARAMAVKMLEAKGWKPGDNFSITAMLALMVDFASKAHLVTDRCGHPDCGCDWDGGCSVREALKTGEDNG